MRKSSWTPSIVPKNDDDQDVYLVVDDFGRNGMRHGRGHVRGDQLGQMS
jgi:hypothetical protein